MKIYTIRDVAQLAGVSVTTVSRVLNHRPDVNAATREKVERVMVECNFVGNANARSLKQLDGDVAALILRGRSNPFLSGLAETMLQFAREADVSFLMESIDEKDDEFQTALRLMHEKRARGFIFIGSRLDARLEVLRGQDVPMVFATVNAVNAGLPRAASVSIDNRRMGREAMEMLIRAGHTKIAIFAAAAIRATVWRIATSAHGKPVNRRACRLTKRATWKRASPWRTRITPHEISLLPGQIPRRYSP